MRQEQVQAILKEVATIFKVDPESDFRAVVIVVDEDGAGSLASKSHSPHDSVLILEKALELAKIQANTRN